MGIVRMGTPGDLVLHLKLKQAIRPKGVTT